MRQGTGSLFPASLAIPGTIKTTTMFTPELHWCFTHREAWWRKKESYVCIIYVSNSDSLSIQSIQLVPILSKSIPLCVTLIETALNLVGLACVGGHIKVFSSMNV